MKAFGKMTSGKQLTVYWGFLFQLCFRIPVVLRFQSLAFFYAFNLPNRVQTLSEFLNVAVPNEDRKLARPIFFLPRQL